MTSNVKYFTSIIPGAPALSASAGSMVDVLDACLVTGWGLQSVTQVVVTSGVAVASVASNTAFNTLRVVLLGGFSTTALNGEWLVTESTSNTFTFLAPVVPNGTYTTGTPTAKIAPLGFEILFTDTNKRIYRSLSIYGNGVCLHVDDTNTATGWDQVANSSGTYRAQTKVDIAVLPTNIDSYQSNTNRSWWVKSNLSTGTSARQWMLVGDDRGFYINYLPNNAYTTGRLEYFGELANVSRPNDKFATLITGFDQANSSYTIGNSYSSQPGYSGYPLVGSSLFNLAVNVTNSAEGMFLARSHTQIGNEVAAQLHGSTATMTTSNYYIVPSGVTEGSASRSLPYPNPPDNGLYFAENILVKQDSSGIRGTLPGYCQVLQTRPLGGWQGVIGNIPNAPGRRFVTCEGNAHPYYSIFWQGEVFLDLIGPWR